MHLETLTHTGQIKEGDTLVIERKDGTVQANKAVSVLDNETNGEEIVIQKRKNHYFITALYLAGKSWAKEISILRAG